MPGLEVRDLSVAFSSGEYVVHALEGLDIDASDGELVLLLGPSGSGKTTLLSCLAAILRPTSGTILVGDTDVTALQGRALTEYRRRSVGIVFQAFNLVPSLTATENVDGPLRYAGVPRKQARARALELLGSVGLSERADHRPGTLSGGQQQRVAIARALAHDPPLVLADEPTAHLDYAQVEGVLKTLRALAAPGRLVIVSTHDDRIVPLGDRVIELGGRAPASRERRTVDLAAGEVLFEEGTRGTRIYVVERGTIEVTRRRTDGRGDEVLATYGPGEYLGELGPLLGFPRAGTARAKRASRVAGYTVSEFRTLVGPDKVGELLAGGPAKRITGRRAKPKRPAQKPGGRARTTRR